MERSCSGSRPGRTNPCLSFEYTAVAWLLHHCRARQISAVLVPFGAQRSKGSNYAQVVMSLLWQTVPDNPLVAPALVVCSARCNIIPGTDANVWLHWLGRHLVLHCAKACDETGGGMQQCIAISAASASSEYIACLKRHQSRPETQLLPARYPDQSDSPSEIAERTTHDRLQLVA